MKKITFEVNLRLDSKYLPNDHDAVHARLKTVLRSLRGMGKTLYRREDHRFGAILWFIAEVEAETWSEKTIYRLAERIGQDAISVYSPSRKTGAVIGPRTKSYGGFRITRFGRYDSDLTKSDYDDFDPQTGGDAQKQHDRSMARRKPVSAGSKERLEKALAKKQPRPNASDVIGSAMQNNPGLTVERVEQFLQNLGL